MTFDQQAVKDKALAHLVAMASEPGWKEQAWHSAKALARDWPEMFGDLPEMLTQRMRQLSSEKPQKNGT